MIDLAVDLGELCGRLLSDLGAEVVKAEPPSGSPGRRLPPLDGDHSLFFTMRNCGKLSAVVDTARRGYSPSLDPSLKRDPAQQGRVGVRLRARCRAQKRELLGMDCNGAIEACQPPGGRFVAAVITSPLVDGCRLRPQASGMSGSLQGSACATSDHRLLRRGDLANRQQLDVCPG